MPVAQWFRSIANDANGLLIDQFRFSHSAVQCSVSTLLYPVFFLVEKGGGKGRGVEIRIFY